MSWMELFQTLVNGFLSLTNVDRRFVLGVGRVLDLTLKINMVYVFLQILSTFKPNLNHLLIESQVLQQIFRNNTYQIKI